ATRSLPLTRRHRDRATPPNGVPAPRREAPKPTTRRRCGAAHPWPGAYATSMNAKKRTGLLIGAGLVGAAVATELVKPADKRTWHGRILGFVPYDLRPPT